ncbi:MAG: ParB/RepB/Spo0J family partition protein [Planctomyces sp.]|nr:ParB/RepB/Spo0J family partition protein [Planctomyces sp.]
MQNRLAGVGHLLNESLGVRTTDGRPRLSPVPDARDMGRRPLRGFGRVDIQQVIPDPKQPRTEFDIDAISSLAANLKAKGQLHPIHVRWSEEAERWVIVSGERRWRAAQHAGLATVDCFFHEQPLSNSQILELQLIENLMREDLRPVEEAKAFQSLMDLNNWNGKQLAEALQIPASKISRSLALLDLPAEYKQQVDTGQIAARTAYELSRLVNDDDRQELASQSAAGKLTPALAAVAVRQKPIKRAAKAQSVRQTFFADNACQIVVTAPRESTYHHLEAALLQALEEVRLRIENNIRL